MRYAGPSMHDAGVHFRHQGVLGSEAFGWKVRPLVHRQPVVKPATLGLMAGLRPRYLLSNPAHGYRAAVHPQRYARQMAAVPAPGCPAVIDVYAPWRACIVDRLAGL